MTLTQHKRISKRELRRRLRPYGVTVAICPSCHLPRDVFKRDRFGQLVCLVCVR